MEENVWTPDPVTAETTNVSRLMSKAGCSDINQLREWSVANSPEFWDLVVDDLDIRVSKPYSVTLDQSDGIEWARWFEDGQINLASACVDRWRDDPERADTTALIAEAEDGSVVELTFAQLAEEVDRLTAALRADGFKPGDSVGVFMPMVAEYGQLRTRVDDELPGTLRLFILAGATSGEKAVTAALDEFETHIDIRMT